MLKIHKNVLEFLLKQHKKDSDFYFATRIQNDERLKKGYFFRGNDTYLNLSFWYGDCTQQNIYNIGFTIWPDGSSAIELTDKQSEVKVKFFKKIMRQIIGFEKVKNIDRWRRYSADNNYLENLKHFINNEKSIIEHLVSTEETGGIKILTEERFYKYMKSVLPVYNNKLEFEDTNKIARLCWNTEVWECPSGEEGKSKNPKLFEFMYHFGHEEWLFDMEKIIDGYHYGFLQQVKDKDRGKTLNISFYTIKEDTREKFWIGSANNVELISHNKSEQIFNIYEDKGWLYEMETQLAEIGAESSKLRENGPKLFFNVKFKQEDLDLFDELIPISENDIAIPAFYYNFQNYRYEPLLESDISGEFEFGKGGKIGKTSFTRKPQGKEKKIFMLHNEIQENVKAQLVKKYGKKCVKDERSTGFGTNVDIVVRDGKSFIFYEVKASNNLKMCIREALSQIMEYSYWPDKKVAKKLIIISPNPIKTNAKKYLNKLRTDFNIPVYYQRFNLENDILEQEEY